MKKILFYTDTPQTGGAELQMLLLAKFLDKDKFEPIIALSNYPDLDKLAADFEKEDIKVIRLKVSHKHDPRHLIQLKKIIKNENIDLIHAHVWNPASCRYVFRAADSTKTPLITTEHDPFPLNKIKDILKKRALKNVSKIIAISKENAKTLRKLYPDHRHKVEVIHNGIDTSWWQSQTLRFTDKERKEIKENLFHAKENTLIIIAIAELHERKGLRFAIEAMPRVVEKYPNTKLVITGEGSERSTLEKLISNLGLERHVILIGRQKDIPKLLKSSNIFVLPSRREGFGLVLTEAMITPLPIVATKSGGPIEIVEDGKTGLLVRPEDSDAIARALIALIKDPRRRERLATAGHARVIEKFNAKKMAEQYEKLYSKTLS